MGSCGCRRRLTRTGDIRDRMLSLTASRTTPSFESQPPITTCSNYQPSSVDHLLTSPPAQISTSSRDRILKSPPPQITAFPNHHLLKSPMTPVGMTPNDLRIIAAITRHAMERRKRIVSTSVFANTIWTSPYVLTYHIPSPRF